MSGVQNSTPSLRDRMKMFQNPNDDQESKGKRSFKIPKKKGAKSAPLEGPSNWRAALKPTGNKLVGKGEEDGGEGGGRRRNSHIKNIKVSSAPAPSRPPPSLLGSPRYSKPISSKQIPNSVPPIPPRRGSIPTPTPPPRRGSIAAKRPNLVQNRAMAPHCPSSFSSSAAQPPAPPPMPARNRRSISAAAPPTLNNSADELPIATATKKPPLRSWKNRESIPPPPKRNSVRTCSTTNSAVSSLQSLTSYSSTTTTINDNNDPPPPPPPKKKQQKSDTAPPPPPPTRFNSVDYSRSSPTKDTSHKTPSRTKFLRHPDKKSGTYAPSNSPATGSIADLSSDGKMNHVLPGDLYSKKLAHKTNAVRVQAGAAMNIIKRAKKFFMRVTESHYKLSKEISKIAQEEKAKVASMNPSDKMNSCRDALLWMLNDAETMANTHQKLAEDVENSVNPPIEQFFIIGSDIAETVSAQYKTHSSAFETSMAALAKRKKDVGDNFPYSQRKHSQSLIDAYTAKATAKRTDGKLGEKVLARFEKEHNRVMESVLQYKSQLASTNMTRIRYMEQELPALLSQLQSVEEMRMNSLRQSFIMYATSLEDYSKSFLKIAADMRQVASAIDAKADMQNFVANTTSRASESEVPSVGWDLSQSLQQLRAEQRRLQAETKGGVFGGTLEDVMEIQKATKPHLVVPEILTALVHKVEELGGYQCEGIFRLSASQVDLKALRAKIEANDYSMSSISSPHVAAGMLKEWLRGLRQVIIPDLMYTECINLCKEVEREEEFSDERKQQLLAMLGRIPSVNLSVLKQLVRVVLLASHPLVVTKTKMTEKNMAIVFAPSILHNPSTDPTSMLHNAKYEIDFAVLCVLALAHDWEADVAATAMRITGGGTADTTSDVRGNAEATLIPGWEAHRDPESGHVYYYNKETKESQWEPPSMPVNK
eukprot:jgi/Bigna1/66223/fgenesh1_pg.1_\